MELKDISMYIFNNTKNKKVYDILNTDMVRVIRCDNNRFYLELSNYYHLSNTNYHLLKNNIERITGLKYYTEA